MKIEDVLVRIYAPLEYIEDEIYFYEKFTGEKANNRFSYREKSFKLEIVRVGGFLIIAGSEEDLKDFRATSATIRGDSLEEVKGFVLSNGGKVIKDIKDVPTGQNMTLEHKDGTIIEYVHHNK